MHQHSIFDFYRIFFAKYSRIFVRSNGWFSLVSTAIITSLIILVIGGDAFQAYNSTKSAAFALVCSAIWIGLFNSIQTICSERQIIKQEMHSGVPASSFLVGHLIFEALLSLAETFVVIAILALRYGGNLGNESTETSSVIVGLFLVFFLIIYSSDVLGLMVSSVVKNPHQAMTAMPFVLIIQLVLSGFLFELKGFASALSNLTLAKWGLKGTLIVLDVNSAGPSSEVLELPETDPLRQVQIDMLETAKNADLHMYEQTLGNLTLVLAIFVLFIAFQAAIAYIGITAIEKDRR